MQGVKAGPAAGDDTTETTEESESSDTTAAEAELTDLGHGVFADRIKVGIAIVDYSAIAFAASQAKIPLSIRDVKVTATVNLNKDDSGFFLDATLNAELPSIDQAQAEALVAKAHTICPYSKPTRGNITVKLQANGKPVQRAD